MTYRTRALPILDRLRDQVTSLDFTAPEIIGGKKHEVALAIDELARACGLVLNGHDPDVHRTLREVSTALRRIATRPTVGPDEESDIRLLANSLDSIALALATKGNGR